jgi:putative acetyltransferase
VALLQESDAFMHALYPPESCHLLDVASLCAPEVQFYVARVRGAAAGCGALVMGEVGQAELKRIFVSEAFRGQGLGRALVVHLEDAALQAGVTLLQLETGTLNAAAQALYAKLRYTLRGPFGHYGPDPISMFMEKRLA